MLLGGVLTIHTLTSAWCTCYSRHETTEGTTKRLLASNSHCFAVAMGIFSILPESFTTVETWLTRIFVRYPSPSPPPISRLTSLTAGPRNPHHRPLATPPGLRRPALHLAVRYLRAPVRRWPRERQRPTARAEFGGEAGRQPQAAHQRAGHFAAER